MRLYLLGLIPLLFLLGCGASPDATLAPKLSQYTTAAQQCSDFLDGKAELTNTIEKECDEFLDRLETANETAKKLNSKKLKKGAYQQTKLEYARQRNKVKSVYAQLSRSIKKATLQTIKDDDVEKFKRGIAFPGNKFITPYYKYMRSKAPLFDKNKQYLDFQKKMGKKLAIKGQQLLQQGKEKKALEYFIKAAKMGNAQAARSAGILYEKSDKELALKWHQQAADGGIKASYLNLGRLNEDLGEKETALKWYLKAAALNDPKAQYQLYLFHLKSNKDEAIGWLNKAATNGYAPAQYHYARVLIDEGKTDKAIDLLHQASQKNYTKASDYLGQYYYDLKLYKRAFTLLSQSKSADAFYLLAKMFEEGAGTKQDYNQAFSYYGRAASLGKREAKADMKRVNALLSKVQQERAAEQQRQYVEKMAAMVKECGEIPTAENVKKKKLLIHLTGTTSQPIDGRNYIIYGDDGGDYFVLNAKGIRPDAKVDISVRAKGSTAAIESGGDEESDIYQFTYLKECVVE